MMSRAWVPLFDVQPWLRPRCAVRAVADATEAWVQLFAVRLGPRRVDEATQLITLLRQARCWDRKKRLINEAERHLQMLDRSFRACMRESPGDLWTPPALAARVGLVYAQTATLTRELEDFDNAIKRISMLDYNKICFSWRMCDAFNTTSSEGIPVEAQHAFEAYWLAGEYMASYAYAQSFVAVHAGGDTAHAP